MYKGKRTNYQTVKSEATARLIIFIIIVVVILAMVLWPELQANAPRAIGY